MNDDELRSKLQRLGWRIEDLENERDRRDEQFLYAVKAACVVMAIAIAAMIGGVLF